MCIADRTLKNGQLPLAVVVLFRLRVPTRKQTDRSREAACMACVLAAVAATLVAALLLAALAGSGTASLAMREREQPKLTGMGCTGCQMCVCVF